MTADDPDQSAARMLTLHRPRPSDSQSEGLRPTEDRPGADEGGPREYAQVAAKRPQPPAEAAAAERSGTGTPISARVAAEVADSAELLHEEVAERERPEDAAGSEGPRQDTAEDNVKASERRQSTIVILEPPPGEGRPFDVQPRDQEFLDDQEEFIADKSPLFAHECVGLYEPEEAAGEADVAVEESARHVLSVKDLNPDDFDLNDPTLERFPSNRQDIMNAVRKLETGLAEDDASFGGVRLSPVFHPSRRGTEDITGDFAFCAPQASSSPTSRAPKQPSRGSISSIPATASLDSISEADESAAEEEPPRPAVVFSNPLKSKPKHLKLPTSDEDEAVALPEGVSPRTVVPAHRPIATPQASPSHSPPSPKTAQKSGPPDDQSSSLAPAEVELDKDKSRSMEEVILHPAPRPGEPDPAQTYPAETAAKDKGQARRRSYAEVAASPAPASGTGAGAATTAREADSDKPSQPGETGQVRKRAGTPGQQQREEAPEAAPAAAPARTPPSHNVPAVHPKQGRGLVGTILWYVFVELVGGIFRKAFGWVFAWGRRRRGDR
ncbi:uncharacterized protein THITE_2119606 [Thermothielavioides terrestris NRRL 8126]|uniref:Uncharacterized protein n=1 Tax=Thermothielavioides terrestris (strain ATCC 38088 / NRRL 8126) TaxID=578455 RepID=G2RC08_THETT|nr:uncharacterized protein THITE_2119606 [Thermothielavioides terrestris NRRL 8126]AEO69329.1 hypothetical protein THITE_2119606 [Thermothielavioides terrestris NRRL 8126]